MKAEIFKLSERQERLFEFVKEMHKGQKRKYTREPYHNHCLEVCEIVSHFDKNAMEAALCHDLYEDTDCDFNSLYKELIKIGYSDVESYSICTQVKELTDKYTPKDYPYMNRKERKENEAKRLSTISETAVNVKYADLISNTSSIVERDPLFAKVYLKEKEYLLSLMTSGNQDLREMCLDKCTVNEDIAFGYKNKLPKKPVK